MRKLAIICLLVLSCTAAWGQKRDLRRGNREFRKEQYDKADVSYRKGLLKDSTNVGARYNLANNLYRQGNFDEAAKQLDRTPADSIAKHPFAADYYFNQGNVAIAKQDWNKAVESYIRCLMLTPDDMAAKENYTYARKKLEEQQQNQNQNGEGGDNNQDQNKNDDQNKDQKDQNQDQQNQQNDNGDKGQEGQHPQPQQVELSPQQAQQLLQAIQDKERQTQEKVDEKKAAALKSRQKEKNW